MLIYEKYIGKNRDDFHSLKQARQEYKITYPEDFNFAYDVMDELGRTKPDKRALVWISKTKEERIFTFKNLMDESNRAANYFKSLGINKGDKVLIVLKRSYLFWITFLALHKIGAVACQATSMLKGKDYVYRCNKARTKAVVITGDDDCVERFEEIKDQCTTVETLVTTLGKKVDGWHNYEEEYEKCSTDWTRPTGEDRVLAKDVMFMAFTSGTTGYPKLIMQDFSYPLGHIVTGVFWHRIDENGLHFTISDSGWLKCLWGKFYGQWFGEGAILVYDFDKFQGDDILSVLEKYKVTTFCVPPTMYRMILQHDVTKYDLSNMKHCCSAGEALNPEIFNKWKKATGISIYEGFGQSETTVILGTIFPFDEPHVGSMGKQTLGYDVSILDSDGRECLPGEIGEICIKATRDNRPCGLFAGYFEDEEANNKCWKHGYYYTGDTAYTDEHGRFKYIGRNDDVIKSSGYRIGPFEVESVLLEHPAVLEVAVTGVPDPVRGFNVKATIVLHKNYKPSDELVKELQTYVKTNTAPYKYPRVVEFVDELPKTFNGKVRRNAIRENDSNK